MDLLFDIIMIACFLPIMPILYFVMRNYTKPKKNLILNVTLPIEAREDELVLEICKKYRKWLGWTALILTVLLPFVFFIQSFSIAMTIYMSWLTIVLFMMFGIFSRYHIKLKRLKKERGWVSAVEIDKTAYENVAWEPPKKLGPGLFFPPVLFSLAPMVHEILSSGYMTMFAIYAINAALVAERTREAFVMLQQRLG